MTDAATRRADLRARIIEVAAQALREEGPAAVTTRGVTERAGVQAPMIYRLFGDKDGLLEAVAEHVMAGFVAAKAKTAGEESDDPLRDLRAAWREQIDFGVGNPALFRLLSDPDRVRRSAAAHAGRQVLRTRIGRVAAAGRLRVSEERAIDLLQAAAVGAIQTLLAAAPAQRDPGLADSLYDAVLGQILTGPATSVRADSDAAAAVALRARAARLGALTRAERHMLTEWLDRVIDAARPRHGGPADRPRDEIDAAASERAGERA
jgi:AcrR family transcriptional regulator